MVNSPAVSKATVHAAAPSSGELPLAYRPDERWPYFAEDEIEAVARVLRSGRVNQWTSDEVFAFEEACAERFGGGHGIAVANGSLALELALRAFGIGPGDEVVVTPRSFVASASCVRVVGATPVFADVDRESGNISPQTIERVLNERTKAVIPVHVAGWPCDMPQISALAAAKGLKVIEDCAQAHGATIDGHPIGSFGDAACFSFCQDKIISTAGEGGFVSFKDPHAYDWAWSYKDHGKNRNAVVAPQAVPGLFRYLHDSVGTNWRLTAPQAAVGLLQLKKLRNWTIQRARHAKIFSETLSHVPGLRVPVPASQVEHAFYKLYFYIDVPDAAEELRERLLVAAAEAGLRLFSGTCSELYLERAMRDLARPQCPIAHELGCTSLMVEVHPTLRPELTQLRAARLAEILNKMISQHLALSP